jgi:hypothetical protein
MLITTAHPNAVSKAKVKQVMINLPAPPADTVPCTLYDEQVEAMARSLGGEGRGWLAKLLIKALLGYGMENCVLSG